MNKFVPRDNERKQLEAELLPKPISQSRRQVFVLHGFGGIGKTQLAVDFARKNQRKFSAIFWLNGSTNNQVQHDLARAAHRVSKEIPEAGILPPAVIEKNTDLVVTRFLKWLSEAGNNRWLLIFDNVDRDSSPELKEKDPDAFDVTRYFPLADHGSILITTRISKIRQLGVDLKLSKVDEQQGIDILENCLDEKREGAFHSIFLAQCVI
jgi:hypothetical protein